MYPDLDQDTGPTYEKGSLKQGLPDHGGAKDVPFVIAFLLHLVVVIGMTIYGRQKMVESMQMDSDNPPAMSPEEVGQMINFTKFATTLGTTIVCTALAGVALSALWLFLMRRYPKQLIIATMVLQALVWLLLALYMLYIQAYFGAIMGLLGVVMTAVFWWWNRHRIPFAAAILSTVATVTRRWPATIGCVFVALFFQVVWSALWGFAMAGSYFYAEGGMAYVVNVFLLLSLYWTAEVIRNTSHVTVSGTFATWYFMGGDNQNLPANPTLKSAKRALTTSFGSICFGSLLVALIQTVRAILRQLRNQKRDNAVIMIIICLVDCILGCIESLVRMFNRYAYVQVAIYGKSFCHAAKDTWKLVKSHGIQAIINDSFIGPTMMIGTLLGGLVCFLVGALVGIALSDVPIDVDLSWLLYGVLGMLIGFVILTTTMSVVDSGVATIFVAYAMDPAALGENDKELKSMFDQTAASAPLRAAEFESH